MIASGAVVRIDELAREVFSVATHFCLALPRGRRRAGDLKDIEFLTLTILNSQGTMIVGDIQRLLGVLPAQMSRIIRSLEARDRPLIACRINPHDKRKIDVCLTAPGEKALADYREHRVRAIADLLRRLPEDDLGDIHGLLDKLQPAPERTLAGP
jgi:DNA-binding MarR family transcriptional regulator